MSEKTINLFFTILEIILIASFIVILISGCEPLSIEVKQSVIVSDKKEDEKIDNEYPLLSAIKKQVKKLAGK